MASSSVGQKRGRESEPSYRIDGQSTAREGPSLSDDFEDVRLDTPHPPLRTEFVEGARLLTRLLPAAVGSAAAANLSEAEKSDASRHVALPPSVLSLLEIGLGRGAPSRLFDWLPDVQGEISADLRKLTAKVLCEIASAPRACASSVRSRGCAALGSTLALLMPVARRAVLAYLAAAQDAGVVDVEPADAAMALLQRAEHFPSTEPLLEGSEWAHSRASTTRATAEAAEQLNAAAGAAERVSLTVCAWSCLLRDFVAAADTAEAWANDFTVQAEAQREGVDALAAAWDEATAQLRGFDRELEGIATGQLLQRGRALPGGADGGAGAGAGAGGKGSSRDTSRSRRISSDGDDDEDGDASGSDGEDGNVAFEAGDVVSTVLDLLHSPRPELTALTARRAECAKRRGAIEATGLALKVEARISTSLAALCRAIMDAIEATALDVLQALQGTLLRRAVAADAAAARAIASVVSAHEAEAARGDAADAASRALRARLADNDAFFRSGAAPVMRMTLQGQLGEEEAASRAAADAQLLLAVSIGRLGEYLATMPLELRETIGERLRRLLRASADAASHAIAAREGGFEYHASSISTSYGRVGTAEAAAAAQASSLAAAFAKSGLRTRLASSLQQALRNSDSMRGASGTGTAAGAGAVAGAPGPLQHVRLLLEQALPAAQLAFDKTVSTSTGTGTSSGAGSGAGGRGSGRADGDLLAPVSAIRLPLAPPLTSRLNALAQALERGAAAAEPLSEESLPFAASALALEGGGGGGGSSGGGSGAGAAPSPSPVLLSLSMLSSTGASSSSAHAAGGACTTGSAASAGEARACGLRPILLDDAMVTLRVLAASQAAWLGAPAPGAGGAGAGAGGDDRSASASASASVDGFWRFALARLPSAADVLWAHDIADTCAPAPAASSASAHSVAGAGAEAAGSAAGGNGSGNGSRPHVLLTSCRSLFDAHALLGPYVPADFASYRRRRGGSGAGSSASGGASGSARSSGGGVKSPAPGGAGAASSSRSHSSAAAAEAAKPAKRSRRDEEEQDDDEEDDDDDSGSDGSEAAAAGGKGKGAEKSSGYCIIM